MFKDLFDSIKITSTNHNKEAYVSKFATVFYKDFEPVTIINPNMEKGPWIAGGAALRWYQDQPVGESDIDVFCRSPKQAADVIEALKSYGRFSVKAESENATTLDYWRQDHYDEKWTIQVIIRKFFNNPQEIIKNFDITVCQIVTDGENWVLGDRTARDIREKNLCMDLPLHDDAVKRLTKYWSYGYRPVEGLLDSIINNPTTRWEFNPGEDYGNAF